MIVAQGEIVPHGYGIAWREWDRDVAVCYPLPLNVIAGWLRRAYIWVRFQAVPRRLDRRVRAIVARAEQEGYSRGREIALRREEAFRAGWEAAFARIEADLLRPPQMESTERAVGGNHMSRVARVLFAPEVLIRLARGEFKIVANPIPPTARVKYCAYDVDRGAVTLVIEDASFADLAPGEVIPILEPPAVEVLHPIQRGAE